MYHSGTLTLFSVCSGCSHEFCIKCALYLCSTSNIRVEFTGPPGSIPCPLCRNGIMSFNKLPSTPTEGLKSSSALTFCNPCIINTRSMDSPATVSRAEIRRNRVAAVSSELVCPITCSPFPSSALPTCRCSDDDPCGATEAQDSEDQSPRPSHSASMELDKRGEDLDRTSCSGMFWSRRSCHREQQCDAEINAWFFISGCEYIWIRSSSMREMSTSYFSSPAVFFSYLQPTFSWSVRSCSLCCRSVCTVL